MSRMILIRGLPGSGKSTLAKALAEKLGCDYFEADMWFVRGDGEYIFDASELSRAHRWCLNETTSALFASKDVIVSNTFTTLREMYPYFHAANDFGCSLYVVECHGQYGNVHNVSEETIQKMKGRWANVDDINFYGENFQRLKTLRVLPSDNIWATLDLA